MRTRTRRVGWGALLTMLVVGVCAQWASAQEAEPQGLAVDLGDFSGAAAQGVCDSVTRQALFELGYAPVKKPDPALSAGLDLAKQFEKAMTGGCKRMLLVGLKSYPRQGARLYLFGRDTLPDGKTGPNPDVAILAKETGELIVRLKAPPAPRVYSPRELKRFVYQVSHIEAKLCLDIIKGLGYTVGMPEGSLPLSKLPIVFMLADTEADSVVGPEDTLLKHTDSSPQQRLMILYHESQQSELVELQGVLEDEVDVPDRQVLIESALIELSEEASRDIGMEYEYFCRHLSLSFTKDAISGTAEFLGSIWGGEMVDPRAFSATLKAMIDERRAEVLSSPSILTLNNRQARIAIIEDVPILSTVVTEKTETLDVRYEKVGITLNIKPRICADGSWVTMQIKTEVSEAPEEEFIEVRGEPVAPVINRRSVETIARIRNNTPFIIGGLIRNASGSGQQRIPIISNIPILGNLFKIRSDRKERREVIIVLTPRVIEARGANRPIMPKDAKRFDFLQNELFRNSYRLKAEDVFDLGFITQNDTVLRTFSDAREYVRLHPEVAGEPPFDITEGVAGEKALVVRMIYEIVKKLGVHKEVAPERIIFFVPDEGKPTGFRVVFMERLFAQMQGADELHPLDRPYPKDVVILRYRLRRREGVEELLAGQVADWEVRRVESRKEAESLVYEYGKVQGYGRDKAAVLLADRSDVERLQAAAAVREVVTVNGAEAILRLSDFQVGRRIVLPGLDPSGERVFLVDYDVADYFFQSDFYYEVFQDTFRSYFDGVREVLDRPGE